MVRSPTAKKSKKKLINPKSRDKFITKHMNRAQSQDEQIFKTLLLGTGGSGKSTIFKQMIKLHGEGLSQDDLNAYRNSMWRNCVVAMCELIDQSRRIVDEEKLDEYQISPDNEEIAERLLSKKKARITPDLLGDLSADVSQLWTDEGIKLTFTRRDGFQIFDNLEFFLDRTQEIFEEKYDVTEEDALRTRAPTSGMNQRLFMLQDSMQLLLVDVGGQRSERRKWIKWFDDVGCIIFVVSVSEFNEVLYEDGQTNRHDESLAVWKAIVEHEDFVDTRFVLFLNKVDLFQQKIQHLSLADYIEDYDGPAHDYETGLRFLEQKYLSAAGDRAHNIVVYPTTATDSSLMEKVLDNVVQAILNSILTKVGIF